MFWVCLGLLLTNAFSGAQNYADVLEANIGTQDTVLKGLEYNNGSFIDNHMVEIYVERMDYSLFIYYLC